MIDKKRDESDFDLRIMAPTREQLTLSASLFTSRIEDWIPAKFGPKVSESERNIEFDKKLREVCTKNEDDKLGLGHSDLGKNRGLKGPSLGLLEKRLKQVDKRGKPETEIHGRGEKSESGSESEQESRSRMVKRKNHTVNDLLKGKKRKLEPIVQHPSLDTHPQSTSIQAVKQNPFSLPPSKDDITGQTMTISPGVPLSASNLDQSPSSPKQIPSEGPKLASEVPTISPKISKKNRQDQIKPILNLEPPTLDGKNTSDQDEDGDGEEDRGESMDDGKMSKTQRRREARRKARLARRSTSA